MHLVNISLRTRVVVFHQQSKLTRRETDLIHLYGQIVQPQLALVDYDRFVRAWSSVGCSTAALSPALRFLSAVIEVILVSRHLERNLTYFCRRVLVVSRTIRLLLAMLPRICLRYLSRSEQTLPSTATSEPPYAEQWPTGL